MKVGFDISQTAHNGGVATYTKNLAYQLQKQKDLEMVYFYSSLRKPYIGNLKNVKSFKLPPTLFEVLFNKIRNVPIEKFLGPIDIYHSSDWVQPPTKAKKITTFHDVIPLKFPQWSHPKIVSVNKRRLKLVEKEVDLIIAVSETTRKDLLEISGIPEEKVVVIYEGVEEKFKPLEKRDIEEFRKKYNLPDSFILSIGGVGERRNLKRVKEAVRDFNLVVTGEDLWVEDEEMPLLYNAATILLYPSLYEGFGLPILEAMACGIPVITSSAGAMKEIAADRALLVNPEEVDDLKKNVKELMVNKTLRKELTKKGLDHVKKFTWQRCADRTAEVYRKLMHE